jgi:hypothetical protein
MIGKFRISCDGIEGEDLSLEEEGEECKIELYKTTGNDLKISLLSNLFAHFFEDAAITPSFFLETHYLLFACFPSFPVALKSIFVLSAIIPR